MQEEYANKKHWATCTVCQGQGNIVLKPKQRRAPRGMVTTSDVESVTEAVVQSPEKYHSVCVSCAGSGLVESSTTTPVDARYPHVAIIGGGIGGTALAVACLHRGIPFTLFERDESFAARSQGYGLTLQQASKTIVGLGIRKMVGGVTSTKHVVHNPQGKIIGEWGLRKWNKPQSDTSTKRRNIHIARQSLRAALMDNLADSTVVRWGHALQSISKNKNGRTDLVFKVGDAEEVVTTDVVVGADGIRSVVRKELLGERDASLQYLGCFVMLGICPLASLTDVSSPLLDSATVFQTVNGHERIYIMPYDTDTVMWQVSFPLPEAQAKELSAKGATIMKEEAIARLTWHEPIPQILRATPAARITGYPVYDRPVFDPSLLDGAGNATLIGDAAHPMSPFKGQGANQALIDALTLARKIAATCGPDSLWREQGLRHVVLNSFEAEMAKRTASKVRDSAEAAHLLHSSAVLHEGDEPRGRGLKPLV